MKLSTGVKTPMRPKPLVTAVQPQTISEEKLEEKLEPVATLQVAAEKGTEESVKASLDPISEAAVLNLPDATPQTPLEPSDETPKGDTPPTLEPAAGHSKRLQGKPFYIALGVGAVGLITALVFRGGGVTNGRSNITQGTSAPNPDPIPTFDGRKLNIQ